MGEIREPSHFRGLSAKLSLPVLAGSAVLLLYNWKLLHLNADELKKTVYFLSLMVPIALVWPIPLNRRLVRPIILYLKGKGDANAADKAAAAFPIKSAGISLSSWTLAAVSIVIFSTKYLHVSAAYNLYLFVGALSGGLAATFIHFHIVHDSMELIRSRIAETTGVLSSDHRYPIMMKLLASFTLLITLSLIFFALMENAHWQQTLAAQGIKLWSNRTLEEWPIRPETAGFIFLTVIIGALISYFAAHDISKHLDEIREATRRIANGDFAHRLHMITDDEVQELAGSVNLMAIELENKIEQLQKARDTAQQKSAELEEANKELLQLDELKSNFLSNISHELKAPLVSTKGYVDFILSEKLGALNAKQQKGLKVACDNLTLLSRLISSLLDFSKLSGGAMKLRRRPSPLKELIESCVESFRLEIREKGKELEFLTIIPESAPMVSVDPDRIREVFMNLLDNADKFTESHGRITISVKEASPNDDFVHISIEDTGIGILKENQAKIFQRFYQVDGSSTRKYGGTGLGLAIVKEMLEAHGCTIRVESEVGQGSKFTFMLPIHRAFHPFLPEQSDLAFTKPQITKLIEVIEDDPHISSVVKALLEEEGFAVIPAHTGADALRIARQHKPDLITLDIYLPDMNGFDLLAELHKDPATQPIPVIVLSILMDKEKGLQLGATDYLEKPIDAEKLRDVIKRVSSALDGVPEMVDQIKRQFPSTQS